MDKNLLGSFLNPVSNPEILKQPWSGGEGGGGQGVCTPHIGCNRQSDTQTEVSPHFPAHRDYRAAEFLELGGPLVMRLELPRQDLKSKAEVSFTDVRLPPMSPQITL